MRIRNSCSAVVLLIAMLLSFAYGGEKKTSRDEAQFDIYVADKKIGEEKFSVESTPDSIRSNSILNFIDPGKGNQKIQIETKLSMNSQYMPRSYEVKTVAAGRDNPMECTFAPGQVNFKYLAGGKINRSGLLVGDRYVILDTNVFHHYIFVTRLFDFSSAAKSQPVEVVVPQEMDKGILKVSKVGVEKVSLRGKSKELNHLRADSGPLMIDLWVDDKHTLYKIAIPAKRIEAIRNQ
jgi:hypothetical protein